MYVVLLNTKQTEEINTKMKKFLFRIVGILASLSVPLLVGSVAHAVADTCTWTGGGSDNNFSTAGNWSDSAGPVVECDNGNVPEAGDTLEFPANVADLLPQNDMTAGISFQAINFTGVTTANSGYTINGSVITLVGGMSNTMSGSGFYFGQTVAVPITLAANQALTGGLGGITLTGDLAMSTFDLTITTDEFTYIGGDITGSGNLNIGDGMSLIGDNTGFTGQINVASGAVLEAKMPVSLGAASANIVVASDGTLVLCGSDTLYVYPQDISVGGNGTTNSYDNTESGALKLIKSCGQGGGGSYVPTTTELSGSITLTSNTLIRAYDNIKITGPLSGSFSISALAGSIGTVTVESSANTSGTPNGTQPVEMTTTTFSDALPVAPLNVGQTEIAIVTGSRGDTYVAGILKGSGTVGNLQIDLSGKLAPGLSPGCINTGNLVLSGTYEVELADLTACTEYDQTVVTGTVDITGATLSIIRFDNMVPRLNNSFTIINNDGTDAVTGNFANVAAGATIVADGITYTLSKTGGDGNDVVLVVTAVDSTLGAPNTGAHIIKSGVVLPLLAITSAIAIIGMNFVSSKKK